MQTLIWAPPSEYTYCCIEVGGLFFHRKFCNIFMIVFFRSPKRESALTCLTHADLCLYFGLLINNYWLAASCSLVCRWQPCKKEILAYLCTVYNNPTLRTPEIKISAKVPKKQTFYKYIVLWMAHKAESMRKFTASATATQSCPVDVKKAHLSRMKVDVYY